MATKMIALRDLRFLIVLLPTIKSAINAETSSNVITYIGLTLRLGSKKMIGILIIVI